MRRTHMIIEIVLSSIRLGTDIAMERTQSFMPPNMSSQAGLAGAYPPAKRTVPSFVGGSGLEVANEVLHRQVFHHINAWLVCYQLRLIS